MLFKAKESKHRKSYVFVALSNSSLADYIF